MNDLLQELLKLDGKALLEHEAVVEAYEGLIGDTYYIGTDDPTWKRLPVIGFQMRDALTVPQKDRWETNIITIQTRVSMRGGIDGRASVNQTLKYAKSNHWIIAATLAYREGQSI